MNLGNAANAQICDPKTLLHWNHIRQGDSRSWRTLANPRQRRILQRLCGRWLKSRGYSPDTEQPWLSRVSVGDMIRAEVDLMVGYAMLVVRATSLRYPRTVRTIKRFLGFPTVAPTGATTWVGPTPIHPKTRRAGEPHLSVTQTSDGDAKSLAARVNSGLRSATFDPHRRWPAMTTMCTRGAFGQPPAGKLTSALAYPLFKHIYSSLMYEAAMNSAVALEKLTEHFAGINAERKAACSAIP